MATLFFIMLFVFITYVGSISIIYGIQPSVSESWYKLPKNFKFLFTLFCWGFAVPAMICGGTALMFFAGIGIAFVGAAAAFKTYSIEPSQYMDTNGKVHTIGSPTQYKDKTTGIVHSIGAMVGVLLSQLSIGLDYHMFYVNIVFILSTILILLLDKFKILTNKIFWIEIISFASICYALAVYNMFINF